jgi:hypothetical protein
MLGLLLASRPAATHVHYQEMNRHSPAGQHSIKEHNYTASCTWYGGCKLCSACSLEHEKLQASLLGPQNKLLQCLTLQIGWCLLMREALVPNASWYAAGAARPHVVQPTCGNANLLVGCVDPGQRQQVTAAHSSRKPLLDATLERLLISITSA